MRARRTGQHEPQKTNGLVGSPPPSPSGPPRSRIERRATAAMPPRSPTPANARRCRPTSCGQWPPERQTWLPRLGESRSTEHRDASRDVTGGSLRHHTLQPRLHGCTKHYMHRHCCIVHRCKSAYTSNIISRPLLRPPSHPSWCSRCIVPKLRTPVVGMKESQRSERMDSKETSDQAIE
jgi:hypothetical protein